jgi:hypothetical protein
MARQWLGVCVGLRKAEGLLRTRQRRYAPPQGGLHLLASGIVLRVRLATRDQLSTPEAHGLRGEVQGSLVPGELTTDAVLPTFKGLG